MDSEQQPLEQQSDNLQGVQASVRLVPDSKQMFWNEFRTSLMGRCVLAIGVMVDTPTNARAFSLSMSVLVASLPSHHWLSVTAGHH